MDKDGYPEEEELKRIWEWPYEDLHGLMNFIRSIWWVYKDKEQRLWLFVGNGVRY